MQTIRGGFPPVWMLLRAPDGSGSGGSTTTTSGGQGTGNGAGSNGNGTGAGSNGGTGTGTGNGTGASTGGTGAGETTSSDPDGENVDASSGKIHGMSPEQWAALPASAREAIKDVARYRREKSSLEKDLEKYRNAEMSEADRLKKEREALDREKQEIANEKRRTALVSQFTAAAEKSGARYPSTVYSLVDPDELDLTEDYTVKNIDAVMKRIRATYPDYFKPAGNIDAGTRGANNGAGSGSNASGPGAQAFGPNRIRAAYAANERSRSS